MNTIEILLRDLQQQFPDGAFRLTGPARPQGQWTLDINYKGRELVVDWVPPSRFGVSTTSDSSLYGEGADEVYESADATLRRIVTLLGSDERTSPPLPAFLSRVREERGLTQAQLATKLGVTQATISGIERRKDVQVSTLRKIVEALGGALEIVARFENASYVVSTAEPPTRVCESAAESQPRTKSTRPNLSFPLLERNGQLSHSTHIKEQIRSRGAVLSAA